MIFKYIFDRITALVGLIFLSPILFLTWILIHIKMPDGLKEYLAIYTTECHNTMTALPYPLQEKVE